MPILGLRRDEKIRIGLHCIIVTLSLHDRPHQLLTCSEQSRLCLKITQSISALLRLADHSSHHKSGRPQKKTDKQASKMMRSIFRLSTTMPNAGRTAAVWQRPLLACSLSTNANNNDPSLQQTLQRLRNGHPKNNITEGIISKVGRNLHLLPNHPLNIIKKK